MCTVAVSPLYSSLPSVNRIKQYPCVFGSSSPAWPVALHSALCLHSLQKLYFCEYSLHFFKRRSQLLRHLGKCKLRHPPGDEIYRKDNISMFEVRGCIICYKHTGQTSI
jgi:hypothetical protein